METAQPLRLERPQGGPGGLRPRTPPPPWEVHGAKTRGHGAFPRRPPPTSMARRRAEGPTTPFEEGIEAYGRSRAFETRPWACSAPERRRPQPWTRRRDGIHAPSTSPAADGEKGRSPRPSTWSGGEAEGRDPCPSTASYIHVGRAPGDKPPHGRCTWVRRNGPCISSPHLALYMYVYRLGCLVYIHILHMAIVYIYIYIPPYGYCIYIYIYIYPHMVIV